MLRLFLGINDLIEERQNGEENCRVRCNAEEFGNSIAAGLLFQRSNRRDRDDPEEDNRDEDQDG